MHGKRRGLKTKAVHLARLEENLLRGTPATDAVKQYAADSGIGERMGWHDLGLLKKQWADRATAARGSAEEAGRAVARRELLFAEALAAGDLATALAADQDRCRLLSLYATGTCRATSEPGSSGVAADE
ncbi:unnamed protein product [Gemmataceae bacterium]|nr:unnamed protein product [Gemmataceae bacterium]VTT97595.1 unnamed protein product [Gemmataceae bacterium]